MREATTIYALSSGAGKAGVAVIRLSGPEAFEIARGIGAKILTPRKAYQCVFHDERQEPIDHGLALSFAGPFSFTGEDVVEFHVHGARAVVKSLCASLDRAGAYPAAPGAFTRRAFDNGKLDLSQTEALADLIDAETEQQRRQALGQLGGRLSQIADRWRRALIDALSPLEAAIDFADEADVPEEIMRKADPAIQGMIEDMGVLIDAAPGARRVREGVRVVLFGPPNSGKSRLLNTLAGSDVAIVSDIAGTTRDSLDVHLDIAGVACIVTDTAGLRPTVGDAIEEEGMRRTRRRLATADLKIAVKSIIDRSRQSMSEPSRFSVGAFEAETADLVLWNKVDLFDGMNGDAMRGLEAAETNMSACLAVSAKTGENIPLFLEWLEGQIKELSGNPAKVALTRERHIKEMTYARDALGRALPLVVEQPELAAEEIRIAVTSLARITGKIDVEDVLGQIFSNFCIGK